MRWFPTLYIDPATPGSGLWFVVRRAETAQRALLFLRKLDLRSVATTLSSMPLQRFTPC